MKKIPLAVILGFLVLPVLTAQTTILVPKPESTQDKRVEYPKTLLEKVLSRTEAEYGKVVLVETKDVVSRERQLVQLTEGKTLHVAWNMTQPAWEEKVLTVYFPIKKGLEGFRFFLINKDLQPKMASIRTLEDLKSLRIGTGDQWSTTKSLKAAQLNLVTVSDYEGLFQMLRVGRFDLFQRGLDEAYTEQEQRVSAFPNLAVEKELALYIPATNYFFVTPQLPKLAERITKGLMAMAADGSFNRLFLDYFQDDLDRAQLDKRRVIRLPNTLLGEKAPLNRPEYWLQAVR